MKKIVLLSDPNSVHTQRWAQGIRESGFNVSVIGFDLTGESEDFYRQLGIANFSLKVGGAKWKYLFSIFRLRKILKTEKPDIVHAHYASSYGLLARLSGHSYYLSVWGSDVILFPYKNFLTKWIVSRNLKYATKVFATGIYLKEKAIEVFNRDIEVIAFGIDEKKYSCLGAPFHLDSITFGLIKTMKSLYGIDLILRAFAQFKKQNPEIDSKLLLVGPGPEIEKFKNLAHHLDVANETEFAGKIESREIAEYYNRMDIAIFASRSESFGVSILEASACERPVIGPRLGGIVETISENLSGYLYEPENITELVSYMEKLVKDRDEAIKLGKQGRTFVLDQFSWRQCLEKQISYYE